MVVRPMLPSFVFVDQDHSHNALGFAAAYRIPSCSLFLVNGAAATVGPDDLIGLRELELVAARTDPGQAFPLGTWVDVMGGPLVGMSGTVIGGSHGYTLVSFAGTIGRVNVPSFLLRGPRVYGDGHGIDR